MPTRTILALTALLMSCIATQAALPGGRCGTENSNFTCQNNMCCSGAGYCGTTEEHCSVPGNCQQDYGWCDSLIMPKGLDVSQRQNPVLSLPSTINECTVPKTLALTFDDGPSEYTEALLDVLAKHKARATFFVAGVNNGHGQIDIRWKDTVVRMVREGHQVGSHTWSHPNLDKLSSAERKMEMYKTDRAITNIIGKMPTFMRPPMVICGKECMKDMKELAYHVVGWQVDSEDWHMPQPSVQETKTRLVNEMTSRTNMFLIQHDTGQAAIDIVDQLLTSMPSGWEAVPLIECLGYTLDDSFQMPKFLAHNGIAPRGCLITGPGLCTRSTPFHDKASCMHQAVSMRNSTMWSTPVYDKTSYGNEHCRHEMSMADQLMRFCNQCKEGDGEDARTRCDSDLLMYQNW